MNISILALLALMTLGLTGCASIVDGGDKAIRINSSPSGAKVSIYDIGGKPVTVQTTPTIVSLKRSSDYFKGEDYKLVFELAGYHTTESHVKSIINGWYLGNFFFGGPVGVFIVDPATGAMWKLSPDDVYVKMPPIGQEIPFQENDTEARKVPRIRKKRIHYPGTDA